MFRFITRRPLWVNILAGIFLALAVFSIVILSLGWLTHHNDARTVPPLLGKTLAQAEKILADAGFELVVQDSVFNDTLKPLQVVRQVPDEYEVVKSSRTVYLTINRAEPPLVEMPNIVGYSLRSAEFTLNNMGLKLGDTTFKPDFAKNTVLAQLYNGVAIQPGAKIRQGSRVDLVIGSGLGASFLVPNLIGLTYTDAKSVLEDKGIGLGSVIPAAGVTDTAAAFVYRQSPERFDAEGNTRSIRPGQIVDIWLSQERPVVDSAGSSGGNRKDSLPQEPSDTPE
ncbi:PASTA domain-containing protein [Niabella drilacis]|uniref:PASTA domain, binds beta-lactams n=1 Tax=Niabella drilacis (strain DSM 25811 / CCM 8410 / CCUG 62505 / LMG 26954 / E90) TaxID=1285928 RepID=A0A1G6KVJ6_NIADE|nr:PASTA domain-containing protein [Niabella drilacis]SDC34967.1 PASTA domain, binds beta-lactams [Niabella drilacis]